MSLRPFLIALQFLSCLPVRLSPAPEPVETGRSLLWYPLVGLLLGAMLWGLGLLLAPVAPLLRAALLLGVWVLTTGALHIDGLGDTADAWVGSHGDRERMLAIMKDPYAGPMAVAAIVVVLLLKFAALETLLAYTDDGMHLGHVVLAPLLARCAMPLLFATTPYVRAAGLGSAMTAHLPRRAALIVALLTALSVCLLYGMTGVIAVAGALVIFAGLRHALLRRLGGTTGDTAGAMIELIEAGVLVLVASVPG